jgi:hypothetical protein
MQPLTDDDFDERGILKDGHRLRVPLMMADSWQQDMVRRLPLATDASSDGGIDLNRPGFRVSAADGAARDAKERAYALYDEEIANAWRGESDDYWLDQITGESEFRGHEIGSSCTVKSGGGKLGAEESRGTIQMVEGRKVCVADGKRTDAMIRDSREAAYRAYDADLQNAWRNQ